MNRTYILWAIGVFLILANACSTKDECTDAPSGSLTFSINGLPDNSTTIGDVSTVGDGGEVTYTILSGNEASFFALNSSTGIITINDVEGFTSDLALTYSIAIETTNGSCKEGVIDVTITKEYFEARVADFIEKKRVQYGIQGLGYTVLLPHKNIEYGLSGRASATLPLSEEKVWSWMSNTKMVTSCIILQMAEDGLLSIDDPISTYGISYPNIDNNYTIGCLLGMNTDFYNFSDNSDLWTAVYADVEKVWQVDDVLNNYISTPTNGSCSEYSYSNTNYAILGRIIETVSGKSLQTVANELVFQPLGLVKTKLSTEGIPASELNGVWYNFGSSAEDQSTQSTNAWLSIWGGAGSLTSTTYEMALLVKGVLSTDLLSQSSIDYALTSSSSYIQSTPQLNLDYEYGRGFGLYTYSNQFAYGHGGTGLHKSISIFDRWNNITIAVVYNHVSDLDDSKRADIALGLYDIAYDEIN
ncbi:MAG: serine hydrolase [Cyclobacteriaceae bacterium]|nr:serine hydrolase [Cyclobacteriaceae bacterium]